MSKSKVIVDQRKEALEYMEKHKIGKLFEILGSELAQNKPEDPNEFLLTKLKNINELKSIQMPVTIFSEKDIDIMFSIFDLTNRGYVNPMQYSKALTAVGVDNPVLPIPTEENIDRKRFVSNILHEVMNNAF